MKRIISFISANFLILSLLAGCGVPASTQTTSPSVESTTTEPVTGKDALNEKKVIFIGNSHTYYGKCVLEKGQSVWGLEQRTNDQGFFYQICKANGLEVSVTNFTFGGHTLKDFYSGNCDANRGHDGLNHLEYLTDRNYDYVILQNGSGSADIIKTLAECQPIMDLFTEVNPNTKFVFLVQHLVHSRNYVWRSSIKEMETAGVMVVDWGALINDVINGTTTVPGATLEYNKKSFIISKSESDGFHPNMLTGYITALMTYCAITGESAVGQDYSFCNDPTIHTTFSFTAFQAKYYTHDRNTNFVDIFSSESDMNGLQQLIDRYLSEKGYRYY